MKRDFIGASDSGAVYNFDWGCARRLAYRIRGVEPDFPEHTPAELERGTLTEPLNRTLYGLRTGRKLWHPELRRNPDRPWLVCHQDDETEDPLKPGRGTVEYKTIHWRVMKNFKKEGIRDSYILQVQHSLAVTGNLWGSMSLLCLEPWEWTFFDIERDQALIDKYLQDVDILWARIENGPLPDALPPTDKRCQTCSWRRTCQGEAMAQVSPNHGERGAEQPLESDPTLLPLATEMRERQELVEESQELLDEIKDEIRGKIGERPGIQFPGGRLLLTKAQTTRWDTKALNDLIQRDKAIAALMGKYRKTSEQTSLRLYWS